MIYLDHAAATPVDDRVLGAMMPYFAEKFFNPSAAYLPAKEVASDYEAARAKIAHAIGAKSSDLVITAGATEANNLAFTCVEHDLGWHDLEQHHLERHVSGRHDLGHYDLEQHDLGWHDLGRHDLGRHDSGHYDSEHRNTTNRILYLATEHDSVRKVAERCGGQAIEVLPSGLVDLQDLRHKLTDETELISISLVNNELGTIQPLAEIAALLRETKIDRMKRGIKRQLLLHSDASQALNLLDINVARLGVDLLTLNSAKIYGPKGVGALYVSHEAKLHPLTVGGGQEKGLRSGTENVPGVVGFAQATELAKEHISSNRKKYADWRKVLLAELQGYELINKKHTLDNFIVVCYNGIDAERLVFLLEEQGVYVATGAACAASKGVRSHVLAAIGLSDEQIAGSLRITFGETNSKDQLHEAARIINEAVRVERMRMERSPQ